MERPPVASVAMKAQQEPPSGDVLPGVRLPRKRCRRCRAQQDQNGDRRVSPGEVVMNADPAKETVRPDQCESCPVRRPMWPSPTVPRPLVNPISRSPGPSLVSFVSISSATVGHGGRACRTAVACGVQPTAILYTSSGARTDGTCFRHRSYESERPPETTLAWGALGRHGRVQTSFCVIRRRSISP